MDIEVAPGKYVVAVSGGVDSVVLLDVLARKPGLDLVVAHFDHGIRSDSTQDATFVHRLAAHHGFTFVTERVELGPKASEQTAREARYTFLRHVCAQHSARAIITAHHQDDLLETAIHNLIRGTGRRGLTSLRSTPQLQRPLLTFPKQALLDYALQQKLSWHNDTTNYDERYTRNYIRHRLLARFDTESRQRLLALIDRLGTLNDELDDELAELLEHYAPDGQLNRRWLCVLPHDLSLEVMAGWLRRLGTRDFDRLMLQRLVVGAKTKTPGTALDINHGATLRIGKTDITVVY